MLDGIWVSFVRPICNHRRACLQDRLFPRNVKETLFITSPLAVASPRPLTKWAIVDQTHQGQVLHQADIPMNQSCQHQQGAHLELQWGSHLEKHQEPPTPHLCPSSILAWSTTNRLIGVFGLCFSVCILEGIPLLNYLLGCPRLRSL